METTARLLIFAVVFVAIAMAETLWPRRTRLLTRRVRWPGNIGLAVSGILILRLLVPFTLAGFAFGITQRGWGVLPMLGVPLWVAVPVSVILLDLAIYGQHILTHKIPFLWRLHRVHHADIDLDVSSALRFHPLEIVLSMGWKCLIVAVIGIPAEAALAFETILNASAMFNHGNLKLPARLDFWLRQAMVTPDMHRVHHSILPVETNSNYGFFLSVWDRIFGTARAQPAQGHQGMTIGLSMFRDSADSRIDALLTQPFHPEP